MFRFLVNFLKVLVIACIIGVSLRVIDVVISNNKTNNIATSNFTNEIKEDEKIELASDIIDVEEQKSNEILEEKIEIEQEKVTKKTDTKVESKEEQKVEIQKQTNIGTITETKNQEAVETKKETPIQESSYTEVKVNIAEKKECDGNNHGRSIGNSNKWFETKDEAIATYKAEIKKWGDKWSNDEISDDVYYKNCPIGYEIWDCPFCNKWTLNYHYDD